MIKKYFMKSVNRITKDFKQKELLPLKLVFFVQASTISVLYPYLTIHMRELGINVEEAAIMSAVIPVIGIIMPPLAGMVADKIGNFKLLLAIFSFIGGAACLLLLLVPVGRVTLTHPDRVTLDFGCSSIQDVTDGSFQLGFAVAVPCEESSGLNGSDTNPFSIDTRLEGCGFACRPTDKTFRFLPEDGDPILKGRSYSIQIQTDSGSSSYHYNLMKEDVPKKKQTKEEILSHRIMANDDHLTTSIRKLASLKYFFPALDLTALSCTERQNGSVCVIIIPGEDMTGFLPPLNKTLKFGLKKLRQDGELREFRSEILDWKNQSEPEKVTCSLPSLQGKNISAFVYFHNPDNNLEVLNSIQFSQCEPRCLASTQRKPMCTNLKEEVLYDPQLTFWGYLVIRVFIGIIGSTSYAMYEVAVIAILREQKADYGLQRIYASIGGMISSPLSGLLIDYASQGKDYTDFRPAFYLYAGLKTGTSILMLFINLEFKKAASNVIADAIEVLKNFEIIALLSACFVLGSAWGYIESFLFWFLEDLGGTRSLMGITITVGGIAGIPLLVLSGPIIDKIGHANVIFIGFVFYAIRLVGYSVIYNPYHCLFFEAMESITSSLAITAAVTYAAKLSTTTTDGSIQGLVGGLYFGVGRGAGSLIGGYLMKAFGTRPTYRIFAVFTLVTGVIYYLFNQFFIRRRPQREGNEICKKEPKPIKTLDSEVKVITEKGRNGSKEYGTIQADNNNTSSENREAEKSKEDKEEKKEAEVEEKKEEKDSFTNPGFIPDDNENQAKKEEESKKKED